MSEFAGSESQGQVDNGDTQTSSDTVGNPAWKEILDVLPTQFHGMVTPKLEAWDRGVDQRFRTVQSQYEPWKDVTSAYQPDDVRNSLELMRRINENPQEIYAALAEHLGVNSDQGQQAPVLDPEQEYADPAFVALQKQQADQQQMMETMGTFLYQQEVQKQEAAEDAQLDQVMTAARQKYGDFHEPTILAIAAQYNLDIPQAIEQHQAYLNTQYQQRISARPGTPAILTPGGGQPSTAVDVRSLSSKDREAYVAQLLRHNKEQG